MTKFAGVMATLTKKIGGPVDNLGLWITGHGVPLCHHRRVGSALVPSGLRLFCAAARACVRPCLAMCDRAVLQGEHAARRLVGSYHSPPHETGVMWSTVVAVWVQPGSRT